jgi:hypothetical protein
MGSRLLLRSPRHRRCRARTQALRSVDGSAADRGFRRDRDRLRNDPRTRPPLTFGLPNSQVGYVRAGQVSGGICPAVARRRTALRSPRQAAPSSPGIGRPAHQSSRVDAVLQSVSSLRGRPESGPALDSMPACAGMTRAGEPCRPATGGGAYSSGGRPVSPARPVRVSATPPRMAAAPPSSPAVRRSPSQSAAMTIDRSGRRLENTDVRTLPTR